MFGSYCFISIRGKADGRSLGINTCDLDLGSYGSSIDTCKGYVFVGIGMVGFGEGGS